MTASSSLTAGAAGRYATALFELASQAGSLDQTKADLQALGAALSESKELGDLMRNAIYTRDQQGNAMAAISQKMGLSQLAERAGPDGLETSPVCRAGTDFGVRGPDGRASR